MRVLIVDDEAEICSMHEKIVRMMGHEARSVQDGTAAIAETKRFHPDLVLLDVCMPGLDGWDVAKQLRADPETLGIRLVAITAMTGHDCQRRSMESGFDAHYNKPVPIAQWSKILAS
jgi:CheY-like chemotaxis protein